jgi:hypothetical protein
LWAAESFALVEPKGNRAQQGCPARVKAIMEHPARDGAADAAGVDQLAG